MKQPDEKKQRSMPNGVLILFCIILLVAVLSYLVPAGEYDKMIVNGSEVLDPTSFHYIERSPASIIDVFLSIPQGYQNAVMLLTMIIIIGGSISIFEQTGAIGGAIAASIRTLGERKKEIVIIFITTFFGLLGAFPAMLEACIPFAPICIAVALALNYDLLVGMAMPMIGAVVGWSSGVTNAYTVGIGHNMIGMTLFQGMGYRMVIFVVFITIGNVFLVRYARSISKDPSRSLVADIPIRDELRQTDMTDMPFTLRHKLIMLTLVVTITTIVIGTISFGWDMNMMSAFYIMGGIVAGCIAGFGPNRIVDVFMKGATSIFPAAFAVGVARGISILMTNSKIIDTIVYTLSVPLSKVGPAISSGLMVLVQAAINLFIPSGSGQAMATLPIMLPLGQIIGITDNVTILAFQFGDGLTNLIYPTVPVVIAYLAFTNVPFSRWFKFVWKLVLVLMICSILFTVGGQMAGWN